MIERFFPEPQESDSIGRKRERACERDRVRGEESVRGGREGVWRGEGWGESRAHLLAGWVGDGRMGGL